MKRLSVSVRYCGAYWGSCGAGGAFAVLGAGAGFGQGRAVCLLPLDDSATVRTGTEKMKPQTKTQL